MWKMQNIEWSIKRKTIDAGAKKERHIFLYNCRTEITPKKIMYIDDTKQRRLHIWKRKPQWKEEMDWNCKWLICIKYNLPVSVNRRSPGLKKNCYQETCFSDEETLRRINPFHGGGWTKPAAMHEMAIKPDLLSPTNKCDGAQPTQRKPEGWKMMSNF